MAEALVLEDLPADAWDAFHAGREPVQLAPDLASCWSRARALGAPAAGAPPEEALLAGEALRIHAEPIALLRALGDAVIDRATARVAAHDFLLLLADPDGVVVRTSGGGGFAQTAADVRLIEGACWSEAARGTNAIGTAATTNRATEVHGHAHFGRSYAGLVCYAAPVRGLDGLPVAVLDATSLVARAHPDVGAAVLDAAHALESLIKLHGYAAAGAAVTRVLGRSIDRMRDPALLVEAPGTIARTNAAARELLGTSCVGGAVGAALGVPWSALLAEAIACTAGGLPIELPVKLPLAPGTIGRRAWRLRVEPLATPAGTIIATLVVLEPGRMIAAAPELGRVRSDGGRGDGARTAASEPFAAIVRTDAAVESAVAWARKLAASDVPVMLLAETGTGKELFARAIHAASPRAAGPWHAVNCGALTPSLLESELFGYAPGAFTGAERGGRPGLFHAAAGGTLFLDEVAEMSPAMQAALLRVVETGAVRRVGDTRLERTDVRIVCATCRDLASLVARGAFREDLYYRLKGAAVRIPALRERTDVLALAQHLLGDAQLAPDAAAAIAQYRWPGNVRELKSVLEVARVASGWAAVIERAHLPPELAAAAAPAPSALDDAERDALLRALAEANGNVSHAAKALGVARSTLRRMRARHRV